MDVLMRLKYWAKRWRERGQRPEPAAMGELGELAAGVELEKKGYTICARNWRHGHDELDLVAWDGDVLVFIEVRSRQADALVQGYDSLTRKKKAALLRVTRAFVRTMKIEPAHVRFDVVALAFDSRGNYQLHHYANVPLFPGRLVV